MKKIFSIAFVLLVLFSCGKSQKSIDDYKLIKVKFAKKKFLAKNGEFSILLPKDWSRSEDTVNSDTLLYTLESGPNSLKADELSAIVIYKMNLTKGNISNEFDLNIDEYLKKISNSKLIGKSKIKIGEIEARTAQIAFTKDDKIIQEEIDIFIPINKNQYYYIGLVSNKNEKIDDNFGMMLECAQSFKLNKSIK